MGSGQSKAVGRGIVCRSGTAEHSNGRKVVFPGISHLLLDANASNESCWVVAVGQLALPAQPREYDSIAQVYPRVSSPPRQHVRKDSPEGPHKLLGG